MRLIVVVLFLVASFSVAASDEARYADIKPITTSEALAKAEQLKEVLSSGQFSVEGSVLGNRLLNESKKIVDAEFQSNDGDQKESVSVAVLVSMSLTTEELRNWFRSTRAFYDQYKVPIAIYFQGMIGRNSVDTKKALLEIVQGIEESSFASVQINPFPFRIAGADTIPAVAIFSNTREGRIKEDAVLEYIIKGGSIAYAWEQYLGGASGESIGGRQLPILEKDFVLDAQERAATLNLEEKAKERLNSFWDRQATIARPAPKSESFYINTAYRITKDFSINGQPIAEKGAVIDPVDYVSFTSEIIAFDARDTDQVSWALRQMEPENAKAKRFIFIATGFVDWSQKFDLEQKFEHSIYYLSKDFVNAFNVKHAPSIIYKKNGKLFAEVFAIEDIKQ